jgi:hypothetical protein
MVVSSCGWCSVSDSPESEQPVASRGYNAGGLVAYPRPDEIVVPLRREEFDILCEGGVSEEKSNRDLYIGGFFGALAGLAGVLATTDWDTTWKPERRWWFFICLLVLCIMVAASVVGAAIHQVRIKRTITNSPFSRLRARLLGLFNEARTPDVAIEELPGTVVQRSRTSGIRWENVASLFWLGNDLDWTAERVKGAAPKERIVHGLTTSYHHCSQLGLADSIPGKLLSSLKSQVESMPEAALAPQWRSDFAARLYQVIQGVSEMAKGEQPGFPGF